MMQHKPLMARVSPLVDLAATFVCAYHAPAIYVWLFQPVGGGRYAEFNMFTTSPFIMGVGVAIVPFLLSFLDFYKRNNLQRAATAIRQVATFALVALLIVSVYDSISPKTQIMQLTAVMSILILSVVFYLRYLFFHFLQTRTRLGAHYRTSVLMIGDKSVVDAEWAKFPNYWKKTIGSYSYADAASTSVQEAQEFIVQNHVSIAILFGGMQAYRNHEPFITLCEMQGIDIYVNTSTSLRQSRVKMDMIGDNRILIMSSRPEYSWAGLVKTILDRSIALVILILTLPIWIMAAIIIKVGDPKGPIFFNQPRSGRYGKPFSMWKFRSMYTDAEARKKEVMEKYGNEMNGPIFKLTDDPRIIPYGNFLRKTSIDELPQLINIILGHMSLVGPRPLPTYETALFPETSNRRRLSVKPGLTCYWQVEDRSTSPDFNVMIEKDLKYIDNWSLWLDVKLFFRTIPAVLMRKGAK